MQLLFVKTNPILLLSKYNLPFSLEVNSLCEPCTSRRVNASKCFYDTFVMYHYIDTSEELLH